MIRSIGEEVLRKHLERDHHLVQGMVVEFRSTGDDLTKESSKDNWYTTGKQGDKDVYRVSKRAIAYTKARAMVEAYIDIEREGSNTELIRIIKETWQVRFHSSKKDATGAVISKQEMILYRWKNIQNNNE